MLSNLYGNPHSASASSQLSTRRIDEIRLRCLQMFNADPDEFDLIFTANATASIKLVMEAFRDSQEGFWYGYHKDCHTSLIGVRELAHDQECFGSDATVESWISESTCNAESQAKQLRLFAYPAQSNMNGRRLPLGWSHRIRSATSATQSPVYVLLDAASLVSTSPLDLSDADAAPDFIPLSLYKIFGFPDLGALIVRKASGQVLQKRRYFGGGTVDMVVCLKEQWHESKTTSLHDQLEDGTLPVHSIIALGAAMDVHTKLYGNLERISRHTSYLAQRLFDRLVALRHENGRPVCQVYKDSNSEYSDPKTQGPIVAFNIRSRHAGWVSNSELEKLASVRSIHLRSGGLCNPGGIASSLELAPWEMRSNFSAGQRCGDENDVLDGKPTGIARVSLGAMSTRSDVDRFVEFIKEFFLESNADGLTSPHARVTMPPVAPLHVESLTIYPIKSCAGWRIPPDKPWSVRREGLAWDREWCLVHKGTNAALSQKRYPRMALITPSIDLAEGVLRIRADFGKADTPIEKTIAVPLSADPKYYSGPGGQDRQTTRVCGEQITTRKYLSPDIAGFFSEFLGVACQLARFPPAERSTVSARHSKTHELQPEGRGCVRMPGAFPETVPLEPRRPAPMLLSNESPILIISRPSVNRLNELIKSLGGKAVDAGVFRANVVVAVDPLSCPGTEKPYAEDHWRYVRIGQQAYEMLGRCRRCQMVCIDQKTAEKTEEPFVTLAKTRREQGKVFFGQHACLVSAVSAHSLVAQNPTIQVGDVVHIMEEKTDG